MILVTGGAGYIGSIAAEALLARGEEVIVYDDLSRGHRDAVPAGQRSSKRIRVIASGYARRSATSPSAE